MRTGISHHDHAVRPGRLEAITRDRNASQKHAWRAAIILLSADGVGTNEIMRRTGKFAGRYLPRCHANISARCGRAGIMLYSDKSMRILPAIRMIGQPL